MNNFFLKDKLQEFIVKNWQDYFDTREIINQISFLANKEKEKFVKVKKSSVQRILYSLSL